ncbi:Glycosyl transferase family 2 [Desulfocicer vacuolatum DSM 3385]|uniref:Glycosyl transferase family 2 n=1 Tax=Desulfocicer vacuolatum DSM 3385 TaxID=1121400 RepID=A0A1W1ZBY4_9BACT|nr:glycosyltransferase [Desulfocicer vacuolatum]SMC45782.1 Glycosyl transferase family 2 [Desulfocicer vacuolatum DSM 3385]
MSVPKVTLLIPQYKTPDLTKLCLRLIRKYTDPEKVHVIVIDNDSQDDSLLYLKSLTWVELIERTTIPGESPSLSHSRALDLALKRVKTPYVLSIHTDTLIKDPRWLTVLLSEIENSTDIAGVGSWKLEEPPSVGKRIWKLIEFGIRGLYYGLAKNEIKLKTIEVQKKSGYYNLFQKNTDNLNCDGNDYFYLRSHCALYRMDLIKKYNLTFTGGDETAGSLMHTLLIEKGHRMIFLSAKFLTTYLVHLNHATMIFNPELGSSSKTIKKGLKRCQKELRQLDADKILNDISLDC